jgi:hypothetical protein
MIDTKRRGFRCRAKKMLRGHAVVIEVDSQGTIVHELENLGRQLILVQWEGGPSLYVFADEIEIMDTMDPR